MAKSPPNSAASQRRQAMAAQSYKAALGLPDEVAGNVWAMRSLGRQLSMHRHDELELNLVLAGSCRYLVLDRRYDLTPGSLIWLFPAEDHVMIDRSPDLYMWLAVFKPGMVEQACTTSNTRDLAAARPTGLIHKTLRGQTFDHVAALCESVSKQRHEPALFNAGLAYLLLSAWQAHAEAEAVAEGDDVHPGVEKAARIIRDGGDDLTLDALAEQCGLSPSRLSRLFKQQTGVALVTYRNRQRIERFVHLYSRGHRRTLTQAALEAGFGSYPQFHRVFKEVMGVSPADYRQRVRE